jgi:hypothetical protein
MERRIDPWSRRHHSRSVISRPLSLAPSPLHERSLRSLKAANWTVLLDEENDLNCDENYSGCNLR